MMLQFMEQVMMDSSSCYYRMADLARAFGGRRICQFSVELQGMFLYGSCLEEENLLEFLQELIDNEVSLCPSKDSIFVIVVLF